MQHWRKMTLLAALSAVSGMASALQVLPDDDLAAATGQAGITVSVDNYDIETSAIRYYDSDGFSSAGVTAYDLGAGSPLTTSFGSVPGPCNNQTNVQCAASFSRGGSLNMNGFSLSNYFAAPVTTTLDVGSRGSGATAQSGLLIGTDALNNLNLNTGGISLDNGDELKGLVNPSRAPTNAPTYDSNGVLTSGNDMGGINLVVYSSSNLMALVTGGAPDLGLNSGLTITSLLPLNMIVYLNYYNTTMQEWQGGELGDTDPLNPNGSDGLISVPVYVYNLGLGVLEIGAGPVANGYGTTTTQGLEIYTSGITADAIDLGGEDSGDTGIQIAGTDVGSIGILGLKVAAMHIAISGH